MATLAKKESHNRLQWKSGKSVHIYGFAVRNDAGTLIGVIEHMNPKSYWESYIINDADGFTVRTFRSKRTRKEALEHILDGTGETVSA